MFFFFKKIVIVLRVNIKLQYLDIDSIFKGSFTRHGNGAAAVPCKKWVPWDPMEAFTRLTVPVPLPSDAVG